MPPPSPICIFWDIDDPLPTHVGINVITECPICYFSAVSQKKWVKLIFCMQINIKSFYELISTIFPSEFCTRWYYQYWWTWQNIFKALKVTSLQYLHSISKKKLGMEFIFCIQININVYTNLHYHFWWKWPDMSKVPKIESSKCFCNIVRKKYCNCFCVLLWYKKIRYFSWVH